MTQQAIFSLSTIMPVYTLTLCVLMTIVVRKWLSLSSIQLAVERKRTKRTRRT